MNPKTHPSHFYLLGQRALAPLENGSHWLHYSMNHCVFPVRINRSIPLKCGLSSEAVQSQWHRPGKKTSHLSVFIIQCQVSGRFILRINIWRLFWALLAISTKACLCKAFLEILSLWECFSCFPRDMAPLKLTQNKARYSMGYRTSTHSLLPSWVLTKETENEDMRDIKGCPIRGQELIFCCCSWKSTMKCESNKFTNNISDWDTALRTIPLKAAVVNSAYYCLKSLKGSILFTGKHI